MLKNTIYTFVLSFLFVSCNKNEPINSNVSNSSKVYVAGIKGFGTIGSYWKGFYRIDNVETVLDSLVTLKDFFVSDAGDVYTVGVAIKSGSATEKAIAYKNGQRINLGGLSTGTYINNTANSVFVYNNDVYIVGAEGLYNGMSPQSLRVWKNGQLLNSYNPNNNIEGLWSKIHVYNNDVYIAGSVLSRNVNNNGYFATVLKNGTELGRYFKTSSSITDDLVFTIDKIGNWYLSSRDVNNDYNTFIITNGNVKNINRQSYDNVISIKLLNNKPVIAQYDNNIPKHSFLNDGGLRIFDFNTTENRDKFINDFHIDNNNIYIVGEVISNVPNVNKSFFYKNGTLTIKDDEKIKKIIVK